MPDLAGPAAGVPAWPWEATLPVALLLGGVMLGVGVTLLVALVARRVRARRERRRTARLIQARARGGRTPCVGGLLPPRWLAVQTKDPQQVQRALGLHQTMPCRWADGLLVAHEQKLFISPPLGRWVLVMGAPLPDPAQDVDRCFHFLVRLSQQLGRVQFFALNRTRFDHAWVSVNGGVVERAYAWAGRTVWHQGALTKAERELGLQCLDYGAEPEERPGSSRAGLARNLAQLPELAARWSVNPAAVDARRLGAAAGMVGELFKPKTR